MNRNETNVIEISSSPSPPSKKENGREFHPPLGKTTTTTTDETPIRHIVCLKNAGDIERFEETEDCFILDFDPIEPPNLIGLFYVDAEDISVVAEKGQVACRDYPHSRHLCFKFLFGKTPHETHCELCYCYVCDSPAPCLKWKDSVAPHCNATENVGDWKLLRNLLRQT